MPETANSSTSNILPADYPALFQVADRASQAAQRKHLWFTGTILSSLVCAALFGALGGVLAPYKLALATASTALVALSFVLTAIRRALKPEKLWYGGRAVAESVKSMSWRYMTGAAPYSIGPSADGADAKFVADLKSMVRGSDQLAVGFGSDYIDRPQISTRMRELRSATVDQRREAYVIQRIADQRRWYGSKARKSQRAETRYFVIILVSQALALASAAYMISAPSSRWNLVGVFSALAGSLVAWLQVRQHEELAQSYAVAALELGFIEEQATHVSSEKDFSAFVADAENAISREHTLWIARRDRS